MTRVEKPVVVLLLVSVLIFNACFCISAGPLWRDEANSVRQASLPSLRLIWESLGHDPFPALYPLLLRCWISLPGLEGDPALRLLGLLTGLGVAASVFGVCRLLGSRSPAAVLVLVALDPLVISESCSIRPYGASLIALLWTFGALGACLARPGGRWPALAVLMAVASVQLSYANAIFVAALCLSAGGLAAWRGGKRRALACLAPGALAAVSLIPYAEPLRRAAGWTSLLRSRPAWESFVPGLGLDSSMAYAAIWILFTALALVAAAKPDGGRLPSAKMKPSLVPYVLWAAAACAAGQVLFVAWMRLPVFPRYFLPTLVFAGIALQSVLDRRRRPYHAAAAVAALLLAAVPAWSRLNVRRTNVDLVAQVLSRDAATEDLVVLSPWFLHPSFQRYYRGPARWVTVPELPASPITRYDLFKQAMIEEGSSAADRNPRLEGLLGRSARVWLVHQAIGYVPQDGPMPAVPALSPGLSAEDYARYRSYWERGIWHLLRARHNPSEVPLPASRRVWDEERLVLTLWQAADYGAGSESRGVETRRR